MPVRRYTKDPRDAASRTADTDVLARFERGEFLHVDRATERDAMRRVQSRYLARRDLVAMLGKELGVLRRAHGLTQDQVARVVGTNKSNISRLESGRYGGLTVERFLAVLESFEALAAVSRAAAQHAIAADGSPSVGSSLRSSPRSGARS